MSRLYVTLLLAAAGFGLSAGLAQAQPLASNRPGMASAPVYVRSIYIAKGSGQLVQLPQPMADLFAADPAVVEVRPASPNTMFVFGKDLGQTTIVATDSAGTPVARLTVVVSPSAFAKSRLQAQAQVTAPGADVTAESEAGGMIVRGTVQTPEDADNVMSQARLISPGGTVVNQLQVREPIQVELKVRIATMSRTITRQLGIDWGQATMAGIMIGKFTITGNTGTSAPSISGTTPGTLGVTFPGGTFQGVIDALASDNLAHVLAEPTLTTLSGTQASFQVGGEFPIPISQTNGAVTVSFRNFGILLTFTPTVFADGRISLQVAPQLSTISAANGVTIATPGTNSAITVPSLNVTQASSTVILGSGQGMAIAGLLEDTSTDTNNAVPALGEVPVLGALFRGDSFQREQQEMVITVTPYLVNPVNQPATLASPDDGWTPPNDLQRILLLRNNGTDNETASIPGDAGFMVQ
jgi:pilus assembly protein CpaC